MNKALVTGASGFIGRQLCEALRQRGVEVVALSRHPAQGPWHSHLLHDLRQPLPRDAFPAQVDVVFHLAGRAHALREPGEEASAYHADNVQASLHIQQAAIAAGARRLIYFSSVKAMGDVTQGEQDERTPCAPTSPYGESKLQAERLLLARQHEIETVILRPCMVYGEGQKGNLRTMISLMRWHLVPPLPDYANHRCMVHVQDLVQAALLAAEHPRAPGQIYIVNDGRRYSTRDIYDAICLALGRKPAAWHIPHRLLWWMAKAGDIGGRCLRRRLPFDSQALQRLQESAEYSTEKIRHELGYQPRHELSHFLRQQNKTARYARS